MSDKLAKKYQKQINQENNLTWWILLIGILLVPLLIGLVIFPFYSPTLLGTASDTGMKAEIFTSLKWYALLIVSGLSMFWFLIRIVSKTVTISRNYSSVLLAILFFTALLSLLFAEYKGLALYGNYDMRDGTLSWVCFLLLCFIAANCQFPLKCERPLIVILTVILFINCVLGLCLFLGVNLTQYPAFLKLLMWGQNYAFSSSGQLYGTMSNPNYLSALASAVSIFFMVYFLKTKEHKKAAWFLIPIFFGFSIILTSVSSSGFATLAICSVVLFVIGIFSFPLKKVFIIKFALLLILFAGMFGIYGIRNPNLIAQATENIQRLAQETISYFQAASAYAQSDYPYPLTDTIVDPDLTLDDPVYTFGTNRGYIWEETLQLIQERPLLGYGMGTLGSYFPYGTKDYFAHRLNRNELVNKPHNFYLGVAYGTGVPAFFALIILFGLFCLKERPAFYPLTNQETEHFQILKTACWLCCISFMIQFLVNDMMLATSVIFWILLGLCISLPRSTSEPNE